MAKDPTLKQIEKSIEDNKLMVKLMEERVAQLEAYFKIYQAEKKIKRKK